MSQIDKQFDILSQQLDAVNAHLKKQLSFKRSLLMSIVSGAGYAIGAGIVAAMIIAILTWTIKSISDVPLLNKIIVTQNT